MSRKCQVTLKKPMSGNNVSHSRRRTKRRFLPNIMARKRFWIPSLERTICLRVSAKGIRLIDKLGIEAVLEKLK